MDEDSSTVCSMCGNPYIDMSERAADVDETEADAAEPGEAAPEMSVEQPEMDAEQPDVPEMSMPEQPDAPEVDMPGMPEIGMPEQPDAPEMPELGMPEQPDAPEMGMPGQPDAPHRPDAQRRQGAAPGQPAGGSRPPRRTRSGPQIYGQEELMHSNPELFANQGAIRRDVPPRSSAQPQEGVRRPAGPAPTGAGRPAGRMPGNAPRSMVQAPGAGNRPAAPDHLSPRVMELARKALKSPLFFVIALLNTVCVASSIAAIFLGELNYSQIVRLLNESNLPSQTTGYVNTLTTLLQQLDSGMIVQNILLHVPSILFCIGLWLIFFTALSARERMSGVGFGFATAAVIIRMIVAGVVMLVTLIVMVTLVIAAWVSGDTQVIIMTVVLLVLTIIVVMMVIMYYFSYLATLRTCRRNADNGESYGRASAYLAVLHILLALPAIIGVLSGIVNMEISGIVGSSAQILWMILFAVWIFLYRGKMRELEG